MASKAAGRLGLLLGAIVVNLAFGELLVRLLGLGDVSLSRATFFEFEPEAGWIGLAHVDARYELPGSFNVRVQCNSRGLRDEEHDYAKSAGVRRIVCIGDSFCWGYGVEADEMVASRIEKLLPDSETINFGANGYSTVQELVRLDAEGMRYAPDWVVLLFCSNDLGSNTGDKEGGRPFAELDENGDVQILNRPVRKPWKSPVGQWIRHHLRLYEVAEYSIKVTRERSKERRRAAALAVERAAAGDATPNAAAKSTEPPVAAASHMAPGAPATAGPSVVAVAAKEPTRSSDGEDSGEDFTDLELYGPQSATIDRAWEMAGVLLGKVQELCRAHGCRLLVVGIADLPAVSEPALRNLAESAGVPLEQLDPRRLSRRLGEVCARVGIPCVDPEPAFRAMPEPEKLYLKHNRHWSAEGHRVAAETIAAKIAELERR